MRKLSPLATRTFIRKHGIDQKGPAALVFHERGSELAYSWHRHTRHQLLYALEGSVRLEVADATFLLPPQRAAFIPAGRRHATFVGKASVVSLFLQAQLVPSAPKDVSIIAASALLREMVTYAQRWSPLSARAAGVRHGKAAQAFFRCFGLLCADWLAHPLAARLPRGSSTETQAALAYVQADPAAASLQGAARAARSSSRTLRRRLQEELGITFREVLTQARMVRALAELAEPGRRVTDVAFDAGYRSLSAFAKAFRAQTGESPRSYQQRLLTGRILHKAITTP